nr:MAG TPA: hypothetical protein [Caudoviricetes sp.]
MSQLFVLHSSLFIFPKEMRSLATDLLWKNRQWRRNRTWREDPCGFPPREPYCYLPTGENGRVVFEE